MTVSRSRPASLPATTSRSWARGRRLAASSIRRLTTPRARLRWLCSVMPFGRGASAATPASPAKWFISMGSRRQWWELPPTRSPRWAELTRTCGCRCCRRRTLWREAPRLRRRAQADRWRCGAGSPQGSPRRPPRANCASLPINCASSIRRTSGRTNTSAATPAATIKSCSRIWCW